MTIDHETLKSYTLAVLPSGLDTSVEIFELPHPSNNESKKNLRLFTLDDQVYQLKTKEFSKGCDYNKQKDLVSDKYHYTSDGQPFKSTFLIDENNRSDGFTMENGSILYSEKYDLTFSLCGYYYRKNVVPNEDATFTPSINGSINPDKNFYTSSDYQERLISNHNENWAKTPSHIWEKALENISKIVEEAGEKYYCIDADKITEWLVRKVCRIINNFPASLKIPSTFPENISSAFKCIMSCNLLVSLIPQLAYQRLINYESEELNIKQHFEEYKKYKEESIKEDIQKEMAIKAAMSTGLPNMTNGIDKSKKKSIPKPKVVKPKVAKGKGRIDGFFKNAKI